MAQFEAQVSLTLTLTTAADRRIAANFAVIYAGAALAIEYGILPWKKNETRTAIEKCMARAFATLRNPSPVPSHTVTAPSIESVARKLNDDLDRLTLVTARKGEPCSDEKLSDVRKRTAFDWAKDFHQTTILEAH